jgi:hypothetical protein
MNRYILVAGMDYQFNKRIARNGFRTFCDNRLKLLSSKTKEDAEFQIFDFENGEIVNIEINYVNGIAAKKKETKRNDRNGTRFTKLTLANYSSATDEKGEAYYWFKRYQYDAMSIEDVYKAVQQIGKDFPGTLIELSFFSHGDMSGPALVNSYDYRADRTARIFPYDEYARLRDDMDPRTLLDFIPPTMDNGDLLSFKNAFHPNGYVWIWGCNFPKLINQLLFKVENNPSYQETGLDDHKPFEFRNLDKNEYLILRQYLEKVVPGFPRESEIRKFELMFRYLKHFFCLLNYKTYSHRIAEITRVKTYAPLVGTFTGPDSGNNALMRVSPIFAKHLNFYQNYLGFKFDPDGRKYGVYDPDFVCPITMDGLYVSKPVD